MAKYTVKKLWLGKHKVADGKPDWMGAGFAVVNQRGEITTFELLIKVASSDYGINVFEVRYAAQDSCDWMNENLSETASANLQGGNVEKGDNQ